MSFVEYEVRDRVATITLNRPERLNALGTEIVQGLITAWTRFRDDDQAFIAILTGAGRAFCVGEDLKESVEAKRAGAGYDFGRDPYLKGEIDKPVIAAVNGYAMGGGLALVARSDLRVAVRGARFQNAGIVRGWLGGFTPTVQQALPHPIAAHLALGATLDADDAYRIGFVNRVVDPEALRDEAWAMARRIAELPPLAVRETMRMLHQVRPDLRPEIVDQLGRINAWLGTTEDAMEARRSFVEKRQPIYLGR